MKKIIMVNNKSYYLYIYLFCALSITQVSAQSVFSSTGKNVSASEGIISYSLGQITYKLSKGESGSLSQGIQQTYKIVTINSAESKIINYSVEVYPNPTTNTLNLNTDIKDLEHLSYQLFNLKGELLETGSIKMPNNLIDISERISGAYILKLTKKHEILKVFRVIKY